MDKTNKTEKNILIAFILNLSFAIFEFLGGFFTNSIAIFSDSIHDIGDALSIGIAYFLEKKSKKDSDKTHTYGYIRYSVLGGLITSTILFVGSILVIYNAIIRIINPVERINYQGMIIFSIVGVVVNFLAAFFTKEGDSINQKSVNLHMLEDVFGWAIVLIGSIIMNFTDIRIIDSIMSIGVSIFILIHTLKNLKEVLDLFLEKTPLGIDIDEIEKDLLKIEDVENVHHIHVWSIDGINNYSTMHIVSKSEHIEDIKHQIREKLEKYNICHSILETETQMCEETECHPNLKQEEHHHHH